MCSWKWDLTSVYSRTASQVLNCWTPTNICFCLPYQPQTRLAKIRLNHQIFSPDNMNQQAHEMSYDQAMSQRWPAVLSVREDVNSDRPEFCLARRSQIAREWHSDPSVKSQVEAFVGNKRRHHIVTPPSASDSVYKPLVRAAEIRVFELLPAKSGQPIRGVLHHVLVDFSVEHGGRPTDFAVSVSEAAPVCFTALSYVVSLSQSTSVRLAFANECIQSVVGNWF